MVFANLRAAVGLSVLSVLPLASASSHFIMGGLNPIAYERVDSIVNPGGISSHTHAIVGASNFGANSDYDSIRQSSCTSVPFQDVDKSVYWAPPVYYQDQNTRQFKIMPTSFNIYYFFDRNGPGEKVHAFPAGLKMLAGSPTRSTYNASSRADQAVSFVCLDYSGTVSHDPAYAERQDIHFPNINACKNGLRVQVFFPQCWDGKNLDSPDHKSHMAYPVDNYNGGTCPSTHPVHTVAIFYEMLIPTDGYNYWGDGAYVLATGDTTFLTHHGDFLNGWDVNVLQDAVDNCHDMNGDINACQVLKPYVNQDKARACTLTGEVPKEDVGINNPIPALPGCNPVRSDFSKAASCAGTSTPSFVANVAPLTSGWTDVGCIAEGTNGRALTGANTKSANMTRNLCAGFCESKGFKMAGIEFGDECYCGNSLSNGASSNTVGWEQCSTACAGNPTYEKCGGPQRLELLQAGATPVKASSSAAVTVVSSSAAPVVSSVAPVVSSSAASAVTSVVSSAVPTSRVAAPVTSSTIASSFSSIASKPSSTPAPAQSSAPATSPVSGTWSAAGCVQDGPARALTGYSFQSSSMTTDLCTKTCASKGFSIAGIEYGSECYCGNSFSNNLGNTIDNGRNCYMSCNGDHTTLHGCGGTWTLSVFKNSGGNTAVAQPPASSGSWSAAGCIKDSASRALTGYSFTSSSMTTELCTSTCASKGFSLASTEFGTECYCGNSLTNGAQVTQQCDMKCSGNKNEVCGGNWVSNLYKKGNASTTPSKRSKHFGRQRHHLSRSL